MKKLNATARARRFVNQSSTLKKLSDYQKSKLLRSFARILREVYLKGIETGIIKETNRN